MIDPIKDKVVFIQFPSLPPSVNDWQRSKTVYTKRGKPISIVYTTTKAKEIINNFLSVIRKKQLPKFSHELVSVKINFCHRWYRKDGTPKKIDIDNRIKPLFDILTKSELISDDSYIFSYETKKVESLTKSTDVFIGKYNPT